MQTGMNKATQAVSSGIVPKGERGEGRRIVSAFFGREYFVCRRPNKYEF